MVQVDALALPHIIAALEGEISRLRQVHAECGDNWPSGFDPNDIGDFGCVLEELRSAQATSATIANAWSKPAAFTAALIEQYLGANRGRLTDAERASLSGVVGAIRNAKFPGFGKVRCA